MNLYFCRFLEQVHESTQKDDDDLTTATSFEFLAPSAYKRNHNEMIAQMPSNDEAMPVPMAPQDFPTQYDDHYENPDDKENIPPIDDKENIPPLPIPRPFPTRAMPQHIEQINVLKTPPDQSIAAARSSGVDAVGGDSSLLSNDLQIGVDLINALIDSRGTDAVTKKKLIRKIVRHLLRSKDTKDITQMIMSYTTEKSNSKISGVSTLVDEDEKSDEHHSKVDQTGKDTISGISTLDSSSSNVSRAASIEPNKKQSNSDRNSPKRSDEHANSKTDNVDEKNVLKDPRKMNTENFEADATGVKEWLLPVTQSEIDKEITRKLSQSQHAASISKLKYLQMGHDDAKNSKSARSNEFLDRLETEKKTQFDWIDQEIEHLKNLKTLLKQINASESDEQSSAKGADVSDEKTNSVYATKHNRDYFTIYENFRRTRKQHRKSNGSQADDSSTVIGSDHISFFNEFFSLGLRNA